MATSTLSPAMTFAVIMGRIVMIGTGAWMAWVGYTLLTQPLAIPFTVAIWLIAALTMALGARGKIQEGWGGFDATGVDSGGRHG